MDTSLFTVPRRTKPGWEISRVAPNCGRSLSPARCGTGHGSSRGGHLFGRRSSIKPRRSKVARRNRGRFCVIVSRGGNVSRDVSTKVEPLSIPEGMRREVSGGIGTAIQSRCGKSATAVGGSAAAGMRGCLSGTKRAKSPTFSIGRPNGDAPGMFEFHSGFPTIRV
jgi:hypothetical protein